MGAAVFVRVQFAAIFIHMLAIEAFQHGRRIGRNLAIGVALSARGKKSIEALHGIARRIDATAAFPILDLALACGAMLAAVGRIVHLAASERRIRVEPKVAFTGDALGIIADAIDPIGDLGCAHVFVCTAVIDVVLFADGIAVLLVADVISRLARLGHADAFLAGAVGPAFDFLAVASIEARYDDFFLGRCLGHANAPAAERLCRVEAVGVEHTPGVLFLLVVIAACGTKEQATE